MGGVLLSPVFLPVFALAGPSDQAWSILLGGVDPIEDYSCTLACALVCCWEGAKLCELGLLTNEEAQVLWHCDDEAQLGNARKLIGSLSARAAAVFWLKPMSRPDSEADGAELAHGSLDHGRACSG